MPGQEKETVPRVIHSHRILNDLYRSRLSRRTIWLLPHPLLSLLSVSLTGDTQEDCERETTFYSVPGEGGGAREKPNITTARKPGSSIDHSILSGNL